MTAPGMRVIDCLHLGRERVIGCWQVDGVLIDPGPASCLPTLLEALGGEQPQALLLTHIHLDHAGASGALARRWPELEVYVHEIGAPHMINPERLLRSARRLYGDDMDRRWGEFLPVPESQLRVLVGGERLSFGSRSFEPTHPGTRRTTSRTCARGPRSRAMSAASGSRRIRRRFRRRHRRTSTSRSGTARSICCARGDLSASRSPTSAPSTMSGHIWTSSRAASTDGRRWPASMTRPGSRRVSPRTSEPTHPAVRWPRLPRRRLSISSTRGFVATGISALISAILRGDVRDRNASSHKRTRYRPWRRLEGGRAQ
jgi:hypothetical protein